MAEGFLPYFYKFSGFGQTYGENFCIRVVLEKENLSSGFRLLIIRKKSEDLISKVSTITLSSLL